MNALIESFLRDGDVKRACGLLSAESGEIHLNGAQASAKHLLLAAACQKNCVIICRDIKSIEAWRGDLRELLPQAQIAVLPEIDVNPAVGAMAGRELTSRRMEILAQMGKFDAATPFIVLALPRAAAARDLPPQIFAKSSLKLFVGQNMALPSLTQQLLSVGYERTDEVERMGDFCVRGGIVDVFPANAAAPYRIEFFGDDIESVRRFDINDRRSVVNVANVTVMPFRMPQVLADNGAKINGVPFLAYLRQGLVVFDEPMYIREEMAAMVKETPEIKPYVLSWENLTEAARDATNGKNGGVVAYMTLLPQKIQGAQITDAVGFSMTSMNAFNRQTALLASEVKRWLAEKDTVVIFADNDDKTKGLQDFFAGEKIPAVLGNIDAPFAKNSVNILPTSLCGGFCAPSAKLIVITGTEIFGTTKKIRLAPKERRLKSFEDIVPGDYVVHSAHGIGRYVGVETLVVDGIHKDYLHIKYGGDDKLYVPVDQVQSLQKYIGNEGETPRLSSMGGSEWKKTKARAKAAAENIAGKLLQIYAERNAAEGFAFSPDDAGMREFEDAFPYEETPDQLRAIADVKKDMERKKPMDRLICGDVGFGKTEVAIRAAYKAAVDGKQTAVLVPTTVLAEQHYHTFTSRFHNFAVTVGVVCRFRSLKEQRETLKKVAEGKIDILIGTHAILNAKKVQFKDLGLLIIDEEQRFGVKQKEKIRSRAAGADVLCLSATPIPRTLHMSLAGARDMSLITTPISDRLPVQTYVIEDDDRLLLSAMKREIQRGGQVYFIYNRVETIDIMSERLKALLPEARIVTAHGQMDAAMLEQIMMEFFEGEVDVLLATTIVENGLDAPNANTIIIYDADRFGLAQLYQMRGRVGRSSVLSFAYFVYRADKMLTETAQKRLQTMKEFAELGAGFKIAMKDLAIRGAGNLLGQEQHGHIAGVGFNMYCQMLEEATRMFMLKQGKGKGKKVAPTEVEVRQEPLIAIHIEAYIDSDYIADAGHKIEIYRRIADIRTDEEIDELTEELTDRFGKPGANVTALLAVAHLKNKARDLGIKSIVEQKDTMDFTFLEKNNLNMQRMADMKKTFGTNVVMQPKSRLMRFKINEHKKVTVFAERLLDYMAGK